jgi:hypothetical protein
MQEVLDIVLNGDGNVKDIIKVATDQNLELKNATVMIGGLLLEHAAGAYNNELKAVYTQFEPDMRHYIETRRSVEAQSEEERVALPPGRILSALATDERLPHGLVELQQHCEKVTKLTSASAKLLFTYTLPSMVPTYQEGWLYLGPTSVASHVCTKFDEDPNAFVFKNWAHTAYSILGCAHPIPNPNPNPNPSSNPNPNPHPNPHPNPNLNPNPSPNPVPISLSQTPNRTRTLALALSLYP